jgi:anti-sigma B factor antagonist
LSIATRVRGSVTILDLSGRFTAGESVPLYDTVQGLLSRGVTRIVLNMSRLDLMDSSGLGELTKAEEAARANGAALRLAQVPDGVKRTLSLSRLANTFEIFTSESGALASFRS